MFRAFLDILFPPLCHVCRTFVPGQEELHLCSGCREKISAIRSPLCPVCGVPFAPEGGIDHTCGRCITERRTFTSARAAARFDGPVQELIHRFKYGKKPHLARPLGLLASAFLADFVPTLQAELIVPVPLHKRRLRQRSFNQAQLLGNVFSKRWSIPLSVHNLRRIRWTDPQTGLSAADRERNVRKAFAVARPDRIEGKRLILVDDVYTTGSTVMECSAELKRAGAREIHVITIARAVM
jgi:ComF family protein